MGDNHEKLKNDINPDSPRNRVECNGVLESRRHHLQDHGLLQVNEKFSFCLGKCTFFLVGKY